MKPETTSMLLPVLPSSLCEATDCANRVPLQHSRRKVFVYLCRLTSFCLCSGFVGFVLSLSILVGQDRRYQEELDQARQERTTQTGVAVNSEQIRLIQSRLDNLEAMVLKNRDAISMSQGVGLAFGSALGFITLIQLVAGRETKPLSRLVTIGRDSKDNESK